MRFPEFAGEWKRYRVSDFLDFYSTNSLSWEQLDYDEGEIKNLHYGLIHKGLSAIVNINDCRLPFIKESNTPKNYTLCKDGDIAFADASEDTNDVAKAVEFVNCDGKKIICGLHTIHGRDRLNITYIGYKAFAFSSPKFGVQINKIAQGTKVFSISAKNFNELFIGIPSLGEQKKIVSLLSLIDERIATQNKIIEEYKRLKDTLVERMFYPSDRQSSLRLKGYNQQWKQHFLKDVVINFSQRNKSQTQYPMFSVTNDLGFVSQSEKFEERSMIGEDISSYKIVKKGDFAYNPARINVGSIAKYEGYKPCMISSLYVCFRPKTEMSPEWLRHLLKSQRMIYNYNLFGEGGVRIYLFFPNFGRIKINVPPLEEQEKIAAIISTIEQKISVENSILNKMNTQKSFLLAKMFI